ncbi:hypothetical protein BFU36_12785 [Sulfolobus sp. A20]|uniref:amidohydrolase family protein n=1 Tax=Saccharolobus sp. A20 TaxID=1891280 RepID=UPI000845CA61|nr:amidohydrolase family protein [Sulfolobus sp. A20]TRM75327.1 amidohydrolase [Sulfolobus sp. E5]TRM76190.1 amidohydrolase [Sulfolobus sp. A20-N-F8]TRM79079.1 amidohydrolase [Sulfolobus sp. B5]TRM81744.1 amidohydrolase [Sulfolobus sp. D5]TRM83268.1 amidohydrolase [Sulfolobus sp. A20-N-F6]TRM85281.1 amidohydrolase [Sulfolobus sp. F3]TRM87727.1 amidohydrolase [Sulfolobus sp. C3]TRN01796.1 amidohydrolase [Sulfolobus sp. F1]
MDTVVVDVHSHFYPKTYVETLSKKGIITINGDKVMFKWGSNRSAFMDISGINLEKKIQYLKKLPYKFYSLLSISAPWTYTLKGKEEVRLVKECNNEYQKIVEKYGEYFGGLATLPMSDVNEAIEEADRAISDLGLHGFVIGTGVSEDGKTIADEEYKPLLERISKLDRPVFLHPGTLPLDKILKEELMAPIVSFPFETTYTITRLAISNKLREYNLKIVIPHGGGFVPYQIGRIDLLSNDQVTIKKDLLKYVYYDTIMYTRDSLDFLYKTVGSDHIVFGTDHPFFVSRPLDFLKYIEDTITEKEKVFYENAKKLFNLKI